MKTRGPLYGAPTRLLTRMVVRPQTVPGKPHRARLHAGAVTLQAAIGRKGLTTLKREGDLKTPAGTLRICGAYFRADRLPRPTSALNLLALRSDQGWCDDPESGLYNRPVPHGFAARHESLWRQDHVYDCLLVTDQNSRPRIKRGGSAIFFHLARDGYAGTEGCIAISWGDMRRLLPRLARRVRLVITRL